MTNFYMLGLTAEQFKIINAVVLWITVFVVYDFFRSKISSDVLFHYEAMFKNIFSSRRFDIRRIRVFIINNDKDITIFPGFLSAFPAGSISFSSTIHWIIFACSSYTIHWIVFPAYIAMVGWVGICEVSCGCRAATRTKPSIGLAKKFPIWLSTLFTVGEFPFDLGFIRTITGTILGLYGRIRLVLFATVKACFSYHTFNCTVLW